MTEEPADRDQAVFDALDSVGAAALRVADTLLREHGLCTPPTVHVIDADMHPVYLGSIRTRAFYRGADAAVAVAAMGTLPAALFASHLMIVWEHADLCTALELPGPGFETGQVMLVADDTGHSMRWFPFTAHLGETSPLTGLPTIQPEWGPDQSLGDAAPPQPVARLLEIWRTEGIDHDLAETAGELTRAGYHLAGFQGSKPRSDSRW